MNALIFKRIVKGIIALCLVCAIVSCEGAVPKDYTATVPTGGEIEKHFLSMGSHEVSYFESGALMGFKKYEIFYPSDLNSFSEPLPVVVFVNGTGVKGSQYPELQRHMASYGFITIATEEEFAWNGFSAEMSVRYLEVLNKYEGEINGQENVFRGRIDLNRIGITGHSQGGYGVSNAITEQRHGGSYKASVILSCAPLTNEAFMWEADASKIKIPTLMIASTGNFDKLLAPLEGLETVYNQISNDVTKVVALRNDCDHGQMLYFADGYVTAWFVWHLQNDESAAKAFVGASPEIASNKLYQDVRINE